MSEETTGADVAAGIVREEKIGIKVADGTFFPVLEANSLKRKRLVLTTVNDNQTNVQIDLYKGEGPDFSNPLYVGSLMIDSIAPAEKGVPEIELKIGFDEENVLNATARDLVSGLEENLSVSIASLDDEAAYDIPEFSLEDDFDEDEYSEREENVDFSFEEESDDEEILESGTNEIPGTREDERFSEASSDKKRRIHPVLVILFILVSLLVLSGLIYFVYNSFSGKEAPSLQAERAVPGKSSGSDVQKVLPVKKEGKKLSSPVKTAAPSVPVVSEAKKTSAGDSGVWYRIRWGDTLWGISYSFYRSPKLYAKIARENKIKNPDLIFAETKIFIPKE